jgi:hypothetical protein
MLADLINEFSGRLTLQSYILITLLMVSVVVAMRISTFGMKSTALVAK